MKQTLKRMISVLLMMAMILPLLPCVSVIAGGESEKYPYTLFASSKQEGLLPSMHRTFLLMELLLQTEPLPVTDS